MSLLDELESHACPRASGHGQQDAVYQLPNYESFASPSIGAGVGRGGSPEEIQGAVTRMEEACREGKCK